MAKKKRGKVGRPTDAVKSHVVRVRLTEDMYDSLKQYGNVSDHIRNCIKGNNGDSGLKNLDEFSTMMGYFDLSADDGLKMMCNAMNDGKITIDGGKFIPA